MSKISSIIRAEKILASYNISKNNSYNETVNKQATKLFRKKTTIALFVIGTPLFILAWPLICAVVYGNAKIEVDQALAHQKISLINTLSNKLKNSKKYSKNQSPEEVFDDLYSEDTSFRTLYTKIFKETDKNDIIQLMKIYEVRPELLEDSIPLWKTLRILEKNSAKFPPSLPISQSPLPHFQPSSSPLGLNLDVQVTSNKKPTETSQGPSSPQSLPHKSTPLSLAPTPFAEDHSFPQTPSLEMELKEHFLINDFNPFLFKLYLEPNEWFPEGIKEHLDLAGEGIHVCTGTERLFFHLLFCDEKKCKGIIGRDMAPEVMKYNTFNILLLRICSTREEYVKLSTPVADCEKINVETLKARIDLIREKTENSDIPDEIKRYYLDHLEDFGTLYLTQRQTWRGDTFFDKCNYTKRDDLFLKLQRYAKSGKIIPTIGDINDLAFLEHKKIAIVDASNIHDHFPLAFRFREGHFPRIVHTWLGGEKCHYSSYQFQPMTEEENKEFDALLREIDKCGSNPGGRWLNNHLCGLESISPSMQSTQRVPRASRSKETLILLRAYVKKNVFKISKELNIDFSDYWSVPKLNGLSTEKIRERCDAPEICQFVDSLVACWTAINPKTYLAFMNVKGWKDAFIKFFSKPGGSLHSFLDILRREGLYEQFARDLGKPLSDLEKKIPRPRRY